jgi:alginate O-acetyltransferase complex protein AlgI
MLFNSIQFVFFYVIITLSYWFLPHKFRWGLLLFASCYFYMCFVPKYIFILGFTIIVDYIAGIYIERAAHQRVKKFILICSLISNIGVLALFKYYNFFARTLEGISLHLSHHIYPPYLNILLPMGLSFHTFQAMSYTIEVYRGNHKAEKHLGIYSLYVMFYPQLVAGPIERPQNILYQFKKHLKFDFENLKIGLMQMAFGLFKKAVIADRLAILVDHTYKDIGTQNGKTILLTAILYSFQIYCDFSGYTDIALGAAKTMGFTLMPNFNIPFFSKNITEFWRRWHISLSSWFNDYLFIPLSFAKRDWGKWGVIFALMLTFSISGLWHGAGLTFIVYGMLNGIAICYEFLSKKFRKNLSKATPAYLYNNISILFTFLFISFSWIFFRSPNMHIAIVALKRLGHFSFNDAIGFGTLNIPTLVFSVMLIVFLLIKEKYYLTIPTKNTFSFYIIFCSLLFCCYLFGVFNNKQFIYFQF